MTFLNFAIAKFETSKFRICLNEAKILQSTFESTKSKTESIIYDRNLSLHTNITVTYLKLDNVLEVLM